MNDRKWVAVRPRMRTCFANLLIVVLVLICHVSARNTWANGINGFLNDPLSAEPPVLNMGVVLPSDAEPVPCPAKKDFDTPLTLSEAADITLCNNAQIKSAWANIKVQAGALGEAKAAYLPTLSGTVSRLKTTTGFPDSNVPEEKNIGHTVYGSFNWMLFDFGGRKANRESASLLLQAALFSHDAAIQKTLTSLIQAYFGALTSKAALLARQDALKTAQLTLASAKKREQKGMAGRSDTLQAAAAEAKAHLAMSRADGDFHKAAAVLVYTMSIPPDTAIILPKMGEALDDNPMKALDSWLSDAQTMHPAIAAARAEWKGAEQKVKAVRAQTLPRLDFSGNYYKNGYPNQGLQSTSTNTKTVGITLTIPLFDASYSYKVYGARAQAEQREQVLRDTEHQILMDVVKTYSDAVSALQNLQSSETLYKTAQESLDSSKRRYDRGAADITEILNTQSTYDDAEQERVRCISEWRTARLSLFSATGIIGRQTFFDVERP